MHYTDYMDTTNNGQQKPQLEEPKHKSRRSLWVLLILLLLLLGVIGYLIWLAFSLNSQTVTLTSDKKQLQSKVDSLTKQLADATKPSTPATQPAAPACSNAAASASLKANIHDAISSKNTAALQGYMATSVTVVIAASEKGGSETAAQAVADLDYLSSATSPWDFAVASATLTSWKAGFYGKYFSATSYAGKAASGQVVSFDFDCNGTKSTKYLWLPVATCSHSSYRPTTFRL
jgi:cytoskeletal protein RodZ